MWVRGHPSGSNRGNMGIFLQEPGRLGDKLPPSPDDVRDFVCLVHQQDPEANGPAWAGEMFVEVTRLTIDMRHAISLHVLGPYSEASCEHGEHVQHQSGLAVALVLTSVRTCPLTRIHPERLSVKCQRSAGNECDWNKLTRKLSYLSQTTWYRRNIKPSKW